MQTIEEEIDAMETKTAAQQEAELMQMRFGTAAPVDAADTAEGADV